MPSTAALINPAVHDAQAMRGAGASLLSLALMDARNRTLAWLAVFDGADVQALRPEFDPPVWLAGSAGWFQERWVARHVRRGRGAASATDPGPRLASIEPRADAWFDPQAARRAQRWADAPSAEAVRGYLAATLETTLELLDKAGDDDRALYAFRLVLMHEDRIGEALAALAQAARLPEERHQQAAQRGLWPTLPARGRREPIGFAAQRWRLDAAHSGWVPEAERGQPPDEDLPEFDIDAQPVGWAQFAEFVNDGGYDERRWWSEKGWHWLTGEEQSGARGQRRVPRYVEQIAAAAGAVLAWRQGRLQRLPGAQSVLHVTAHEAEAWCRWAGRRLPTEAEWSLAAASAAGRGFVWGDGLEWVLGTARAWPGAEADAALLDPLPADVRWRVLRGGSAFGSARLRHPRARRWASGGCNAWFTTFRSCSL